jgi:hypothetical protein
MARLFTSQTPASPDNSDGTPGIVRGMTVRFAVNGTVNGVWFYATTTTGGTEVGYLWTVNASDPGTGTLLTSQSYGGSVTGGAWNYIAFGSPQAVTAGTPYRIGAFNPQGRYVYTGADFAADKVNGDITADADGDTVGGFTIKQGTYRISSTPDYPNSDNGNKTNYFVDVDFTPAGGTAPVSSSVDLRWQVRETVSSGVDLRWSVKSVASAAMDLRWAVKSVASADLDARWAGKSAVSASLDARWALLASVSASLDLRWAQRALVEAPLDLRWSSAGRVTSSIDLQWAVLGPVASALDLRWGVSVGVSAPLAVLWDVRERVAAPLDLLWVSDAAPLSTERIPTDIRALLTQHIASNVSPVRIVYRR